MSKKRRIEGYVVHESGMPKLLAREQPFEVVHEAIDAVFMLATRESRALSSILRSPLTCDAADASMFRALLHSENTDNGMGRSPLLDPLCRHLLEEHPSKQDLQVGASQRRLTLATDYCRITDNHHPSPQDCGNSQCDRFPTSRCRRHTGQGVLPGPDASKADGAAE